MAPRKDFDVGYYGKPKQVKPLFDISAEMVASKASYVENFINFPEVVGNQIFKKVVATGKLTSSQKTYKEVLQIWEKFLEAYGDLILPCLNLSHSLLAINEFTEPLCFILKDVVELDLSYCCLGPLHDVLVSVAHAKKLKVVSLRRTGLNDISIQKLTMPVRKFKNGPIDLVELDLSGNRLITDKTTNFLAGFTKLERLNLSGTSVTEEGVKKLEDINLYTCSEEEYISHPVETFECSSSVSDKWKKTKHTSHPIETSGWAAIVIEKWKEVIEDRRKRKIRTIGVYGMCRSHRLYGSNSEKPKVEEEPPEKKLYFKKMDSVVANITELEDIDATTPASCQR